MTITNFSTAIFLVNPAAKAVLCSYEQDATTGKGKEPFTLFKSLDPALAVGEFVVVPTDTRHGKTVVRVEKINDAASVDLESAVQVKWIIDAVKMDAYETILAQEAAGIEQIKSAELRRRREELHAKLIADNPDLAALVISIQMRRLRCLRHPPSLSSAKNPSSSPNRLRCPGVQVPREPQPGLIRMDQTAYFSEVSNLKEGVPVGHRTKGTPSLRCPGNQNVQLP